MRHRREIRTCEAALKSLSTAAKLDSVELIFVKAAARVLMDTTVYPVSGLQLGCQICKLMFSVKLFSDYFL